MTVAGAAAVFHRVPIKSLAGTLRVRRMIRGRRYYFDNRSDRMAGRAVVKGESLAAALFSPYQLRSDGAPPLRSPDEFGGDNPRESQCESPYPRAVNPLHSDQIVQ
jgi:hypothetical protein